MKGYYYDASPLRSAYSASYRGTVVCVTRHTCLAWLSFKRIQEETEISYLTKKRKQTEKIEGNRTKWTECILYNALIVYESLNNALLR